MNFMDEIVALIRAFWNADGGNEPKHNNSVFASIPGSDFQGGQMEILLLDLSASMSEDDYPPSRLDGAKQASISFIKRIAEDNPETIVCVISFSTKASLVSAPLSVGRNMVLLQKSINGLQTESSTNISAGLKLSGKMIAKSKNALSPRILLLTDGASNEGGSPMPVAERLKAQGIQLDIIGIGGSPEDVNENDLRKMASVINGETRYWFIKSVGQLIRKFENLAIREVS